MRAVAGKTLLIFAVCAALAACGRGDPQLLNFKSGERGPDEFAILPNKPLQAPDDFTALPTPTPGGSNLVDQTPEADAIAALGGNPAAVARSGTVPASDAALINHAARYGVSSGIRRQLAQEDLEFRRRNRGLLLERLFSVSVYFRAYRRMSLDKYAELERFRRLGVRTPAAPPVEAIAD